MHEIYSGDAIRMEPFYRMKLITLALKTNWKRIIRAEIEKKKWKWNPNKTEKKKKKRRYEIFIKMGKQTEKQ